MRACTTLLAVAMALGVGAAPAVAQGAKEAPKPTQPQPKKYRLEGKVVAVKPAAHQVTVDGPIEGLMSAMAMPYVVKDSVALSKLAPGQQITADVVVGGSTYMLENIVPAKGPAKAAPAAPAKRPGG